MPEAQIKTSGAKKPTLAASTKKPVLKKANGSTGEHPAVSKAKDKELPVKTSLPGMEDKSIKPQVVKKNPLIEQTAIQKKKISRDKVALMAEEAKLDAQLRELLAKDGITHYHNDGIDVELVPTKDKLIIKTEDEDDE
jgi:hypothetical protein